jgi:hypothetical protein
MVFCADRDLLVPKTFRVVSLMAGLGLIAMPAWGKPKLQGVGAASVGYTDNVQSSPDPPVPGVPEKTGDAFLLLSPGVVLASTAPGAVHRASYIYTANLFLSESDGNSSSNRLDYLLFLDPAPRYTLLLGASVLQSHRNSAGLLPTASSTPLGAALPGTTSFVQLRGEEALGVEVARDWRATQGWFGSLQTPLSDEPAPRTYETGARLGIERLWIEDAAGVEGRAVYSLVTGGTRADGTPTGNQRQLVAAGVFRWRHDWGYDFTSRAEAGVMRVQRLDSGRGFWEPTGAAALAYATEDGEAEVAYEHTATTSPLLGESFLIDEVRLRGSLPLADDGVVTIGLSTGYQDGRLIAEDATLQTSVDVFLGDIALGWQTTDELTLDVRYQHAEQRSDAVAPPLPLSYARNTVMLGAIVAIPPEREMPRRYRPPRRVDRTDELYDAQDPAARMRER